ncbi:histone-lysine n-methyltransferase setmar-like protein [Elysia marginata]|uniref:Histone-lysine n-methyltransferase setmar-like protein n=1 Tax=Elysia marginata TaxID=1093978 RepID=A0AAV4EBW9_9GAST|nr:histone-lysine n-methyltransferase setmar-like protein [Elysia marginata]
MAGIIESSSAHQSFSRYDIRVIITFSVIWGKDASCIHKDLVTVLGENALSIQTVRIRVKAVSEGRDDMEDEPRPGRPVTACGDANISKVLVSLSDDTRKTCEEIPTETSMSTTSVFRVITNKLNKKKFSKWVPHLLTDEQKESRVNFSRNFLRRFQTEQIDFLNRIITDEQKESRVYFSRIFLRRFQTEQIDFLDRIITGDETWVYSWDPETKQQSAELRDFDEPLPEKVRRKKGALKVMHMIFFYMNGVILRWPVPIGTKINAQYYKKVLQDKLRPAIRKKRPGLFEVGILFHHDNAPVIRPGQ